MNSQTFAPLRFTSPHQHNQPSSFVLQTQHRNLPTNEEMNMDPIPFLDGGTPHTAPATDPNAQPPPNLTNLTTPASQKLTKAMTPPTTPNLGNAAVANDKHKKPTFLTLPRELRDIIYDYAFTQQVKLDKAPKIATSRNAALLCTCRQVYREGLKSYYQNTTFISFNHRSILTWLGTRPSRVRRWVKDMRRVNFSEHYPEARSAYTIFVSLCQLVRDISGGDIADGVLKTSFVGKDDTFVWYSLDQVSGSKRVEDVPAFRDFYHHHHRRL